MDNDEDVIFRFFKNAVQINKGVIVKGPSHKAYRIQTHLVAIDVDPHDADHFVENGLGAIIELGTLYGSGGYLSKQM